jgi:hypothetical protein
MGLHATVALKTGKPWHAELFSGALSLWSLNGLQANFEILGVVVHRRVMIHVHGGFWSIAIDSTRRQ